MRGLIFWSVVGIGVLSLMWTTRVSRRILSKSLGRKLRQDEETSLRSWMSASDDALESAPRELERNPFERVLRALTAIGVWRDSGPRSGGGPLLR